MTEEQKAAIAAAQAAEAEAAAAEEEANADDIAEEPIEGAEAKEVDEDDLSTPDYEALLKAERARTAAAEKAAAELAFKGRKNKREDGKEEDLEEDDDEEDKPLTRREARAFMSAQGAALQKTAQETAALAIVRANTDSEAEAQYALQLWKTRVTPTGNLEEDVLFAIGGITRKKTVGKAAELARALKSKETALHGSATVHRTGPAAEAPKLSQQDAYAIKKAGMAWDGKLRVYKKPLGNGKKHLFFDPKTSRRWAA